MDEIIKEKIYTNGSSADNSAMWAALMNKGCDQNSWLNNPFLYLIFLAMFGGGNFLGRNNGVADASLAQQMQDNHNSDLLMGAIKGNADLASRIATAQNCDANALNLALSGLKSTADLGFSGVTNTMQSCCCNSQKEAMRMGYENQISNLQQTNALQSRIDQFANSVGQGFAQVGYATQAQTCELKTNQDANTQRIIDTMNNHWTADLRDKLFEMSQSAQTASIVSQLKTTA